MAGVSTGESPTNYLYSQPPFDQSGGTNISVGQAVPVGFTAVPAINLITGSVRESGTNIAGVNVFRPSTPMPMAQDSLTSSTPYRCGWQLFHERWQRDLELGSQLLRRGITTTVWMIFWEAALINAPAN